MDTKHILKEYIQIYDKYKSKYGENTVVLMEVGSFFEIYAVINDEVNIGPDIYHICQNILQISVTKRNKKIQEVSYNNYLQAGFPNVVIQKFENILLNNNYTVVIVEHITKPPNPERGVTRVVSPGTSLDNYNKEDNHFLMSIYIEKNEYLNKEVYTAGISTIDLSTGRNYLHSIISKLEDSNYWNDEIGRYIHFYNPSEIIFHFKNTIMNQEKIIQNWKICCLQLSILILKNRKN
jgi:DNA mismatch repair protein MutS